MFFHSCGSNCIDQRLCCVTINRRQGQCLQHFSARAPGFPARALHKSWAHCQVDYNLAQAGQCLGEVDGSVVAQPVANSGGTMCVSTGAGFSMSLQIHSSGLILEFLWYPTQFTVVMRSIHRLWILLFQFPCYILVVQLGVHPN